MPEYEVEDTQTKKTYIFEGDHPPSEQEILSNLPKDTQPSPNPTPSPQQTSPSIPFGGNPLVSFLQSGRALATEDPLNIRGKIASIPKPEVTLPVIGGLVGSAVGELPGGIVGAEGGTLLGRELKRSQDVSSGKPSTEPQLTPQQVAGDFAFLGATSAGTFLPEIAQAVKAFPLAQSLSTGVGAAGGEFLSEMITGKKPDPSTIALSGVENAAFAGMISVADKVLKSIPEFFRANKLRNVLKLDGKDVSRAVLREGFVENIQQEAYQTVAKSGENVGEQVALAGSSHPDITVNASNVSSTMEQLVSDTPGLQKSILKAADELGEGKLVRSVFPELTVPFQQRGAEPVDPTMMEGARKFRQAVLRELKGSGQLKSQSDVSQLSAEETQRLKRVFREVFKDTLNRRGHLDMNERGALALYTDLKESQLKAYPELKDAFAQHHETSSRFRQVEGVLKNLDRLESSLNQHFGGSSSQVAFQKLLSPEVYRQALDFANAHDIVKFNSSVVFRAARFGSMIPIYLVFSSVRRAFYRRR